jgi:hypothetical protein
MPTTAKCRDRRSQRGLQKFTRNRANAEVLPIFLGGRFGKGTADHPPFGEAADPLANDRQVSGSSFAALFGKN